MQRDKVDSVNAVLKIPVIEIDADTHSEIQTLALVSEDTGHTNLKV